MRSAEASLCDRCSDPGACCRRFLFGLDWDDLEPGERTAAMRRAGYPFVAIAPVPVDPETRPPEQGPWLTDWIVTCPEVTTEGRCRIYAARPDPCRALVPGDDPLCVMAKSQARPDRN